MMILCHFEIHVVKYLDTTKCVLQYSCKCHVNNVTLYYGTPRRAPVQCESRNVTCCNLLDQLGSVNEALLAGNGYLDYISE